MIRIPKCPVCGQENDLEVGITCSKCGSFLTDGKSLSKKIAATNKKYKDDPSSPSLITENPFFNRPVPVISTPSLSLNRALYTNGIKVGSRIEIFGPESCGKTTLAAQLIREFQLRNGASLYIDLEHSLDSGWMKQLGVDVANCWASRPNSGTQAIDILGNNHDNFDCIVLDTVALLYSARYLAVEAEFANGDVKDKSEMAGPARLINDLQIKYGARLSKSSCTIVLLNQARENIVNMKSYGIKSPGGYPMRHFCTHRVKLQRVSGAEGLIKDDGENIGFYVNAQVVKNKGAQEGGHAKLEFIYGKGFQKNREYINAAIECGFFDKAGAWYKRGGNSIAQGFDNLIKYIDTVDGLEEEMKKTVDAYIATKEVLVTPVPAEEDDEEE